MTPIVLQHGICGFGDFRVGRWRYHYFHRIERALRDRGHSLIVPRVSPFGSIARRAEQLRAAVCDGLAEHHASKAVILGHSMGGLDARYMISRLGMADRVTALVTVSTPHRGSAFADYCLGTIGRRLGGKSVARRLGIDLAAIPDLTITNAPTFNESAPDAPGVAYYSVSAARTWWQTCPVLLPSHRVISRVEGANDGFVSVASASAHGTHLGTWPVDHFHTVNKRLGLDWPEPVGDVAPRYLALVDRLTADGHLTPRPAHGTSRLVHAVA